MDLGQCSFEEVHALAENIEGWLLPAETDLLYTTAANLKCKGAIVEIGSWCSKSITYLCAAALKSGNTCKKICIDPFINSKDEPNGKYETFIENLKTHGIYEHVTHIKEKSQIAGETFDEDIEMLFIDGFHKYDAVKTDFELFYPKIVENGYVAIHDVLCYEGPTKVVIENAQNNHTFKILELTGTTILAQKVNKLTAEDILNNKKITENIKSLIQENNLIPIK